jgi:hypothetical protein
MNPPRPPRATMVGMTPPKTSSRTKRVFLGMVFLTVLVMAKTKAKDLEQAFQQPYDKVWSATIAVAPSFGTIKLATTTKESGTIVIEKAIYAQFTSTLTVQVRQVGESVIVRVITEGGSKGKDCNRCADVKYLKQIEEELVRVK